MGANWGEILNLTLKYEIRITSPTKNKNEKRKDILQIFLNQEENIYFYIWPPQRKYMDSATESCT